MENFHKKIFALLFIVIFATYAGMSKFAMAEDDDDRYEESEDEEDDDEDSDDDKEEEEIVTRTIRLPDKYITKTILENIIKKDTDRDGLLDENDPHPEIAEIYIVSDQNKNGIDDKYDL